MSETELRWILLIAGILLLAAIYIVGRKEHMRRRRRREQEEADGAGDTADVSFTTRAEQEDFAPEETERFGELENILFEEVQTRPKSKKAPAPAPQPEPKVKEEIQPSTGGEPETAPAPAPAPEVKAKGKSVDLKPAERSSATPKTKPKRPAIKPRAAERPSVAGDKIISLYVVARQLMALRGEAILKAAEGADLEYGEMQVFNRVVERSGRRQIVFSVANAVKPGTFDLDDLWGLTTPGLVLFMQLPGPLESLKAFNAMLDCAKKLAGELDAELRDERRSVLSNQTIDHMREQIQLYSLRTARTRNRAP